MSTPQKPNDQKRKEKSKTKSYGEAKPVKERLAAVFTTVGGSCSFVVAWATVDNHRTTLIIAIIVGVISFGLAGYFYWSPTKEQDKGNNISDSSLAQLRLSAQSLPPPVELQVRSKTEYTEDVFQDLSEDILWRWHYKPQIDNTPRNITPYCLECELPRPLQYDATRNKDTSFYLVRFECQAHRRPYYLTFDVTPSGKIFDSIKKLIRQKIEDGSWLEVVNKQRMQG